MCARLDNTVGSIDDFNYLDSVEKNVLLIERIVENNKSRKYINRDKIDKIPLYKCFIGISDNKVVYFVNEDATFISNPQIDLTLVIFKFLKHPWSIKSSEDFYFYTNTDTIVDSKSKVVIGGTREKLNKIIFNSSLAYNKIISDGTYYSHPSDYLDI